MTYRIPATLSYLTINRLPEVRKIDIEGYEVSQLQIAVEVVFSSPGKPDMSRTIVMDADGLACIHEIAQEVFLVTE